MQRYDTMLEQIQIRKAELSQKILRLRSEETDQEESLQDLKREYDEVTAEIDSLCDRNDGYETELSDLQEKLNELNRNLDAAGLPQGVLQAGISEEYYREIRRLWEQYPQGHGAEEQGAGTAGSSSGYHQSGEILRDRH